LLKNPEKASVVAPLPSAIEKTTASKESKLGLTPSQLQAYRRIRGQRVVAVLGPPGTGKTHFLASMILGLASAHEANGAPFRVLVTAFTHAAIENLLKKISQLSQGKLKIGKAKGWKGTKHGDELEDKKISDWLADNTLSVLGATVYSCLNARRGLDGFDLVVVDEASQVRVPEAAIPASLLAESGRLVLAGDDKQLPPIVAGRYPVPTPGEPILHQLVFQAIRSVSEQSLVCTLNENFRMNDVLTSFASRLLYGKDYRCVNEKVASARLQLTRKKEGEGWLEAMLAPESPLVLAVLDGMPPGKESALEAELVASVVVSLRERLKAANGCLLYPRTIARFA
jgi:DNA replication ATP-dependent helicase Dna2